MDLNIPQFLHTHTTTILVCSVRGANSIAEKDEIRAMAKLYMPKILILLETHLDTAKSHALYHNIPLDGVICIESDGHRGRLMMMWSVENSDVTLIK